MSGTLSETYLINPTLLQARQFINQVAKIRIVDIGRVDYIIDDTHAMIRLLDTDTQLKCEVVNLGCLEGGIQQVASNQYVLIIFPCTPVSMYEQSVTQGVAPYDTRYAKCIPLGIGNINGVSVSATKNGFTIAGEEYSADFTASGASILGNDTKIVLDPVSQAITLAAGIFKLNLTPSTLSLLTNATFDEDTHQIKTAALTTDFNSDGSVSLKTGVDFENDKCLTSINIDTEGNIALVTYEDGEEKASLKIGHDGTINLLTTDAYSITGQQGVVIDGQDGKVSLKNSQYSLLEAFNDLITVLDTFKTQGSPAAHQAVPQQFAQVKQKIEGLLE